MSRHDEDLPTTSRTFTTAAWWLFCAPARTQAAAARLADRLRPDPLPLVPEPVAVLMAGGAVCIALEGAWPLLAFYVAACALSVAALRRAARP